MLKGGKVRLFGGAGVGKTVIIRNDQQHRQGAWRRVGVRRCGRAPAKTTCIEDDQRQRIRWANHRS
jgi:hypothetical protein